MTAPEGGRFGSPYSGTRSVGVRLEPGSEPIPGYRLLEPLGRGGFGEVWSASGPDGNRLALKFIRQAEGSPQLELSTFQLLKRISHPNLLPVFEAWNEHGFVILAMELAEKTLMDRCRQAWDQGLPGIPFPELIKYVEDAAKGIDFLNDVQHHVPALANQESGFFSLRLGSIQHRDIKPQNLFLVRGGVKVADFGLAKYLEHTVTSHTGAMTPGYAAPEFFEGRTSSSSDQYSLALTYCYLRGGRLPFAGTPAQIMAGHLTQKPDLTMIPEDEWPVLTRALAKKPKDRWPNCSAFVSNLSSSAGGETGDYGSALFGELPVFPADTQTEAAATTARPRQRRKPVVILLVCCLLAFAAWQSREFLFDLVESFALAPTAKTEPAKPSKNPPAETVKLAVEPAPVPTFHLSKVAPVALTAGETFFLEVGVERDGLNDAVILYVEGLSESVRTKPAVVDVGRAVGTVELAVELDCPDLSQEVLLVGKSGKTRVEQQLRVAIKSASVQLLPIANMKLNQGDRSLVEVKLQRKNYNGPVHITLNDLPDKVVASSVSIKPYSDQATFELIAAKDAAVAKKEVKVVAHWGSRQTGVPLSLSVESPPSSKPVASRPVMTELNADNVVSLLFYEAGDEPIPRDRRAYQNSFKKREPKSINWELILKHSSLESGFETEIEVSTLKPDGSQYAKHVHKMAIEKDQNISFHSSGLRTKPGGSWLPGVYRVELKVKDRKIAGGQFEVLDVATETRLYMPPAPTVNQAIWKVGFEGRLTSSDPRVNAKYEKVQRFVMEADREYTVDLMSRQFDGFLRIEDSNGAQVAQDDDGGEGLNAKLVFKPSRRDDYRLVVTSYGAGATGDYELSVATSGTVGRGGIFSATLGRQDYFDRVRRTAHCKAYSFWMVQGHRYTIDLKSSEFDGYLRLEDSVGNELTRDDDSGGGLNARINFDPPRDAMYRIIVTSYTQGATGRFQLEVK